jgi:hypothetical protein
MAVREEQGICHINPCSGCRIAELGIAGVCASLAAEAVARNQRGPKEGRLPFNAMVNAASRECGVPAGGYESVIAETSRRKLAGNCIVSIVEDNEKDM